MYISGEKLFLWHNDAKLRLLYIYLSYFSQENQEVNRKCWFLIVLKVIPGFKANLSIDISVVKPPNGKVHYTIVRRQLFVADICCTWRHDSLIQ